MVRLPLGEKREEQLWEVSGCPYSRTLRLQVQQWELGTRPVNQTIGREIEIAPPANQKKKIKKKNLQLL